MKASAKNIAASVRQRLLDESKRRGMDFDVILVRFAIERLLSRLSHSPHAKRFVLKGAMLFAIWEGDTQRPTRDMDLLGFPKLPRTSFNSIVVQTGTSPCLEG